MNALNTKAKNTADKLLKKFGAPATYIQFIAGAGFNPVTQEMEADQEIEHQITTYPSNPTYGMINGGLASASDVVFMVSALELVIAPKVGDKVLFSGKEYQFISNQPTYGGSDIALHQIICKAH